ncbi:hypothetical protein BDZ89DRAFT_1064188 [Hymenopellis radicata]|nr:hypothetical protein BDZ89DRAFT_1064188 [Hymenopellis radicata]
MKAGTGMRPTTPRMLNIKSSDTRTYSGTSSPIGSLGESRLPSESMSSNLDVRGKIYILFPKASCATP